LNYTNDKTAGVLDPKSTTNVRLAIRSYLKQIPSSPPVSIYTAGKLCVLLNVPTNQFFTDNMALASAAYKDALANNPANFTPGFPAFLGLCLIDGVLSTKVADPADMGLIEAIGEFGINSDPTKPEWNVIDKFVGHPKFQEAQGSLLNDANTSWRPNCGDQFFFWVGANEHAIM